MPFDGIVLNAAVRELNCFLTAARIDKVFQTQRDEIVLLCRNESGRYNLTISCNAINCGIHLTKIKKENPLTAPRFAMLLRKHLAGGRIISIEQIGYDRIVCIKVLSRDELGDESVKQLMIEIMGKHSNIILLNEDGIIYDAIKTVDFETSRVREVMPLRKYVLPPQQNKYTPNQVIGEKEDEFSQAFLAEYNKNPEAAHKAILSNISGFSPFLCKMIVAESQHRGIRLLDVVRSVCRDIINSKYQPTIFKCNNEFHVINFNLPEDEGRITEFGTTNEMLDNVYSPKEVQHAIKQKTGEMQKHLQSAINKTLRKIEIHKQTASVSEDYDINRIKGELLLANVYAVRDSGDVVELDNFYDLDENSMPASKLTIELDVNKTVPQNAQMYFKKYQKQKATYENALIHYDEAVTELEYLNNVAALLANVANDDEILQIKEELTEEGYLRGAGNKGSCRTKKKVSSAPLPVKYVTPDGYIIYIGKNNKQNDYLTCKMARSEDIWFHLKNAPGSHVVISTSALEKGQIIPGRIFETAAALAAWYSSHRDNPKADVDYTKIKHVKKIPGGKPGMVTYTNFKTITVTPCGLE